MNAKVNIKKILVIGGAGYIGTDLCFELLKKGYSVICYDLLVYNNKIKSKSILNHKNFKFIKGDINKIQKYQNDFDNLEAVIILAGLVGDPITKKYKKKSRLINYVGIKNCIDFFKKRNLSKLIFISTCSNYGIIPKNHKADENYPLKPISLYSEDKVKIEKYLLKNKNIFNFKTTILRFATAFGVSKRMRFDLTINDFLRQLYFYKKLTVFDPDTWRPYCHVKDFTRCIIHILNAKTFLIDGEVFNVGSDQNNITKNELIKKILKQTKIKAKISYLPYSKDLRNYKVSFKKIENKLKFKAKYSVSFGINEILKSLKGKKFKKKEILGNYKIKLKT